MCFTCRVLVEKRGCLLLPRELVCFFLRLLHTLWSLNGLWDALVLLCFPPSCCPLLCCASQRQSQAVSCECPQGLLQASFLLQQRCCCSRGVLLPGDAFCGPW